MVDTASLQQETKMADKYKHLRPAERKVAEEMDRAEQKQAKTKQQRLDKFDELLETYVQKPLANLGYEGAGENIRKGANVAAEFVYPNSIYELGMGPVGKAGKAAKALDRIEDVASSGALKVPGAGKTLAADRQLLADVKTQAMKRGPSSTMSGGLKGVKETGNVVPQSLQDKLRLRQQTIQKEVAETGKAPEALKREFQANKLKLDELIKKGMPNDVSR